MVKWLKVCTCTALTAVLAVSIGATSSEAGDIYVGPGDDLGVGHDELQELGVGARGEGCRGERERQGQ